MGSFTKTAGYLIDCATLFLINQFQKIFILYKRKGILLFYIKRPPLQFWLHNLRRVKGKQGLYIKTQRCDANENVNR